MPLLGVVLIKAVSHELVIRQHHAPCTICIRWSRRAAQGPTCGHLQLASSAPAVMGKLMSWVCIVDELKRRRTCMDAQ